MRRWHVALANEFSAREIVDSGILAEELGFAAFWLTDIRQLRDCWTLLGAIAARTRVISLATGVNDPYSRHPLLLAESAATLDELAPGRVIVGIGAGTVESLALMGSKRDRPVETIEAGIRTIRGLTKGEACSIRAPGFTVENARVPFAKPPGVRIALASHSPRIYALAGKLADIAILANYTHPAAISWARERVSAGIQRRPDYLDPVSYVLRADLCISERGDEARDYMYTRLRQSLMSAAYGETFLTPLGLADIAKRRSQVTDADVAHVASRVLIAGDGMHAAEQLERLGAMNDIGEICCRIFPAPGQTPQAALRGFARARPN
jgi:alkanesulfonate monooxygenase SsuD/methylene tetrahydromethanopterin reductase-like flavin-dependent oxidoreductase (luciferase family)